MSNKSPARIHQKRFRSDEEVEHILSEVSTAVANGSRVTTTLNRLGIPYSTYKTWTRRFSNSTIPKTVEEAVSTLGRAKNLNEQALKLMERTSFLRAWHALLFLFPGLHPDNALDHGDEVQKDLLENAVIDPSYDLFYVHSGWPVVLEPLGQEAWRRYDTKQLTDKEFYSENAQRAGLLILSGKTSAA